RRRPDIVGDFLVPNADARWWRVRSGAVAAGCRTAACWSVRAGYVAGDAFLLPRWMALGAAGGADGCRDVGVLGLPAVGVGVEDAQDPVRWCVGGRRRGAFL